MSCYNENFRYIFIIYIIIYTIYIDCWNQNIILLKLVRFLSAFAESKILIYCAKYKNNHIIYYCICNFYLQNIVTAQNCIEISCSYSRNKYLLYIIWFTNTVEIILCALEQFGILASLLVLPENIIIWNSNTTTALY